MQKLLAVILLGLVASCGGDDDAGVVATADTPDVTVASLNILHGLSCPFGTDFCRVGERVDLFFDWVENAGCPDVLTIQEVLPGTPVETFVEEGAAERCSFAYEVWEPSGSQNFTLSRYPVVEANEERLLGGRIVWHTRIDHPTGLVDVFNTHLAAGIDDGPGPCREPCPMDCVFAGAVSNRDCQAVQVANFADLHAAPNSLRVLAGDFNSTPETFVYRYLVEERGWVDSYDKAGNPECDAVRGVGCTSGREDSNLSDMESPANGVRRRIDYLFVQARTEAPGCNDQLDTGSDADADGFATKIFADDPNPFAATCGPAPNQICWPSDHEGTQADINCL